MMRSIFKITQWFGLLGIALLLLSACSTTAQTPVEPAPVDTAAAAPSATASPTDTAVPMVSFAGVSFQQDPALFTSAIGQVVSAQTDAENNPFWEVFPAHVVINLEGYPVQQSYRTAQVFVYPVAEYRSLSPAADQVIADLIDYLDTQPADVTGIPALPPVNAAQVFHSNVQPLNFQNGRGVRFLTQYGQYPPPVNNDELFYTFQGLTDDGRYVVAFVLPVTHPNLIASADALSQEEYNALDIAGSYYPQMVAMLNGQPASSFTPDLARLDALVQSLLLQDLQIGQ